MHLSSGSVTARVNPETGRQQMLTTDLLNILMQHTPRDAYCVLGLTLRDLYPDPAWNFVFGQASLRNRVGVYSLGRYDPRFYGKDSSDRPELILRRSCKVLAHETAHMFGIDHCIYFRCVMNGSNHMDELDSSPLHLCPLDLRKLYASISLDLVGRYAHLAHFFRSVGFTDEAVWTETQLTQVAALPPK
jgi:archaemetzincin